MSRYYFNRYSDAVMIDEDGGELQRDSPAREWARDDIRFHAGQSITEHAHLALSRSLRIFNQVQSEMATVRLDNIAQVGG